MIKNLKIFLLFFFHFFFFCAAVFQKENSANHKAFVNTDSLEIDIADSILESYKRCKKHQKK